MARLRSTLTRNRRANRRKRTTGFLHRMATPRPSLLARKTEVPRYPPAPLAARSTRACARGFANALDVLARRWVTHDPPIREGRKALLLRYTAVIFQSPGLLMLIGHLRVFFFVDCDL